jgi:hypothetical protein
VLLSIYINFTMLDWSTAKLAMMQRDCDCIDKWDDLATPECMNALNYTAKLNLPQDIDNPITAQKIKDQLNALVSRRAFQLAIQMPIFGVVLDINDLGILSAILLVIF